MTHVIQVRDVPDDVHAALTEAAHARGLSLTRYVRAEMERLARQAQIVHQNAEIARRTQAEVGRAVDRETILSAIREGRGE